MKSLNLRWLLTACALAAVCALICLMPAARAAEDGTVSGCAYVDADENLVRDENEQLITGVPVRLERLEQGAWTEVMQTETDLYGKYTFTGLSAGEYRVACTLSGQELYAVSVGTSMASEDGAVLGDAVTLESGKTASGGDVGLASSARLKLTVFQDSNGDGKRGDYDRGVSGIEVTLLDGETPLESTVTDEEGKAAMYAHAGRYTVRVTLPAGYGLSDGSVQSHIIDLDVSFSTGEEEAFTLAVAPVGALGGKVFEDIDNDGVMGEDEPGVAGVTVHIEGNRTGTVRDITTDETGVYLFDFLPDDMYTISATLPEGMLYARYSQTGGDLRSIFTGSNITREFAVRDAARLADKNIGVIENGVISGVAFLDLNYNGRRDEGEPGYAGVTVEALRGSGAESQGKAVTGEDGAFRLEGLRGGDYQLRAILPNDGSIFSVTDEGSAAEVNRFEQRSTRREFTIGGLTLGSGGETTALVGVARTASVSGVVFEDAGYDGVLGESDKRLSGLKVYALDADGQTVATATTNGRGEYTLEGIMPGAYTVAVQRKAGYGFTRLRPAEEGGSHVTALVGDLGMTAEMDIAMGDALTGVNAGMLPASTVGGVFFHDVNDNGLRDENEIGMLGAQVRLVSEDGEIDLVQTPAEDGSYFFDGVMPGRYTLHYLLKEHCEMARVAEGGNTVAHGGLDTVYGPFEVVMGEALTLPTAGAVTLGNFSGAVFEDLNANGQWDEGEKALAGATVTLAPDRTGIETAQAVTGADGAFDLEGLRPAGYTLTVALPEGYIFSCPLEGLAFGTLGEQSLVCAWQTLTDRTDKAIGAVEPGSISGVIWLDENEDGSRGEGELLMSGVSLELVDERGGTVVKRTASTDQGFRFDNVRPGTYTVRLTLPEQSSPAGDSSLHLCGKRPEDDAERRKRGRGRGRGRPDHGPCVHHQRGRPPVSGRKRRAHAPCRRDGEPLQGRGAVAPHDRADRRQRALPLRRPVARRLLSGGGAAQRHHLRQARRSQLRKRRLRGDGVRRGLGHERAVLPAHGPAPAGHGRDLHQARARGRPGLAGRKRKRPGGRGRARHPGHHRAPHAGRRGGLRNRDRRLRLLPLHRRVSRRLHADGTGLSRADLHQAGGGAAHHLQLPRRRRWNRGVQRFL